ncbi:hypothetical protein [Streptomyces sp. NBC_01236]|uniref:hypothetical protein n=1 Tax=Streptomyces sp. NBC_01236 TaxID=2903789 RepID=UPI002E10C85C|nr:hypothetical protein OG324_05675 [Streptomyces sp. NBC_01236]
MTWTTSPATGTHIRAGGGPAVALVVHRFLGRTTPESPYVAVRHRSSPTVTWFGRTSPASAVRRSNQP